MRSRQIWVLALGGVMVVAACTSAGTDDDVVTTDQPADESAAFGAAELPPDIIAAVDATPVPDTDLALPETIPATPAGAPGYSRYVFQAFGDDVIPTMVEGPREGGIRCQDPDLPCSYNELIELAESGDEIPPELGMDRATLEELADQLRQTRDALAEYADPSKACADGFRGQPVQVPNMGSHWWNIANIVDGVFDPAKPEIILYGVADNVDPGSAFSDGVCDGDTWTGDRDLVVLGASFLLPPEQFGPEHPEGFAGDIDMWHVHYNLCNTFIPVPDKAACDEMGGVFAETTGWMNHVWTNSDFDNQLGVFTMWNPAIYPATDPTDVRARFDENPDEPNYRSIENFDFGEPITVAPGTEITFANTDAVAHTVTAGEGSPTGEFDTGVFGPGTTATITVEEEGTYNFYCVLHPGMVSQVTVKA